MTLSRPVAVAASALALVGLLALTSVALAGGGQAAVSIVDKTFSPADLTVNAGDSVVWTVTKAFTEPHSVTSGASGEPDSGKLFDSTITLRKNGDTFSQTFSTPGHYAYYCQVHPTEMKATITVLAPGQTGTPASAGGERAPIQTSDKVIAAAILVAVLVVLFGAAWFYRRVNR